MREEIAGLEREIFALAGEEFLIASPQQLGEILFEKLGLSRKRRGKTGYSTDARVLQAIRSEHEIVPKIERWRELSTLIKTYMDVLPQLVDEHSRIHTTFLQAVAQTGRLSSTNPNMQNVPIRTELGREIRGCFEAEPGWRLISADYSQVELRVLANAADEPALMEIFTRGEDVHTATASQVFGVAACGDRSGHALEGEDDQLRDRLRALRLRPRRPAEHPPRGGEGVHRRLPGALPAGGGVHDRDDRAGARGAATCRPCGAAGARSRSCARATTRCAPWASAWRSTRSSRARRRTSSSWRWSAARGRSRESGLQTRLILTIHDELLFEGPPGSRRAARELIEREMIGVWDREPPMAVDIGVGENWLEAK